MPSTYTPNLGLEKPATGEQAGVWGSTVNNSYDFLDTATDGSISIPLSASSYVLQTSQGTPSTARNKVIVFTGALSNDGNISIQPATAKKIYFVTNKTSGGFSLIFKQDTGPSFTLHNGRSAVIYADGIGSGAGVFGALSNLQVDSLLVTANLIVNGQVQWGGPATFNTAATFQSTAAFQGMATFQGGVTVNVGGDQPYDLYYRSPAGALARLPIGTNGQALTVSSPGLAWTTITAAINMPIVGSQPNQIFFADAGAHMVQSGNLAFNGTGLGLGMPAQRALSIGGNFTPTIQLDSASGVYRTLLLTTGNVARWLMGATAE